MGRLLVVHLHSSFAMHSQNSPMGKFIPKITNYDDVVGILNHHISKTITVTFCMLEWTFYGSFPHAKFRKNRSGDFPL